MREFSTATSGMLMQGGHSCLPPLTLILFVLCPNKRINAALTLLGKAKSKAADKSVRPTPEHFLTGI